MLESSKAWSTSSGLLESYKDINIKHNISQVLQLKLFRNFFGASDWMNFLGITGLAQHPLNRGSIEITKTRFHLFF